MSAPRFKSRDDYFSKRSNLTKKVILVKPKKSRKRHIDMSIPVSIVKNRFCQTVDRFEIDGEGRFSCGEYKLDKAIEQHMRGDSTVMVNPLSQSGNAAWNVLYFDLSDRLDHPFSKAQEYARALRERKIPSLVEVTRGGKGHYHLWIFYEIPVHGRSAALALITLGRELFGIDLESAPSPEGETYVPLPLQGESVLLQRCVFVNTVGKMIKDQRETVEGIELCSKNSIDNLIEEMSVDITQFGKIEIPPKIPVIIEQEEQVEEKPSEAEPVTIEKKRVVIAYPSKPRGKPSPEKVPVTAETGTLRIMIFSAGDKEYGIDCSVVKKITGASDIVPLPGTLTPLAGVIQVNEMCLPVIRLGELLGHCLPETSLYNRILILNNNKTAGECGLLVDRIYGIREVTPDSFSYPRDMAHYIWRVAKFEQEKRAIPVINAGNLIRAVMKRDDITETTGTSIQTEEEELYVIFSLGVNYFGLPAGMVDEIRSFSFTPGFSSSDNLSVAGIVSGVNQLRVIDIREQLGIHDTNSREYFCTGDSQIAPTFSGYNKERILVIKQIQSPKSKVQVNGGNSLYAVRVDGIEGIHTIKPHDICSLPAMITRHYPIWGFARLFDKETLIYFIDIKILNKTI